MMKRIALLLILCLLLTGCASGPKVYVQSVRALSSLGGIAPGDRFQGMVVSEHVSEIEKDSEKDVKELLVTEGQDVQEGEPLFSYDTEQLQLTLDKQRLELEQLHSSIESYKKQIAQLEKERETLGPTGKLQYTIQIQTTQVDLKEAELNVKTKENEVKKSEDLLENATVTAPVAGRIQSISEGGTDQEGKPIPYITIQQIGSYRIKGILGELQRGALQEGDRIVIRSRTDPSATWGGTITLVDYESPTQENSMDMYYGNNSDEMSASSRYPFYASLDSTQGLLLGQHVYLERELDADAVQGLEISSAFFCFQEDGTAYVWAEKGGKLEKRTVQLGDYQQMRDTYVVLSGLTEKDYIAFPDETVCTEGAPTTKEQPAPETQSSEPAELPQ